jgi:hypothetical protein
LTGGNGTTSASAVPVPIATTGPRKTKKPVDFCRNISESCVEGWREKIHRERLNRKDIFYMLEVHY